MAETDNHTTMEEQTIDESDGKNQQQESAYGSLESSSQGQSDQKSSYGGSKSLNSGSSYSSGFGDNADFSRINRLKDIKHKDHKRKKTKEKTDKLLVKDKPESFSKEEKKGEKGEKCTSEEHEPRVNSETASSITTGIEESTSTFNCHGNDTYEQAYEQACDQPTLVYTQALNYIRKIKERSAEQGVPFASPELIQLPRETADAAAFLKSFKSARGFTVAISVQDGTVLHVSPAITDVLDFPKDMLIGQSFIDFVYPKDSINFSSKIIHGLNMPFRSDSIKDNHGTSFFCRMRMYHGLRSSGFGIRNKRTVYKPCKIILKFHDLSCMEETASTYGPSSSLLMAEIIPIESVYKVPGETPAMGSFSIRHSASCNFSEYDPEAIPYLGHLPQDLTGNSVFDCYHPEDLPILKSVYEEIVKQQGKPHRSKPYRFRTFNGSYVTLETEWLCFVNPWTKQIDSIIGQHRVLKGPNELAIFQDPADRSISPFPEEVIKEAQKAQKEIIDLLAKPVATYRDPSKEPQVLRRRTLAHMMSSIVDELDNLEKNKTTAEERVAEGTKHRTWPPANNNVESGQPNDQASVVMGEISPHQDDHCYESNPSTSTPSSYSKLNYNETMQRFFRSHPKTVSSDESGDGKMEVSHIVSSDDKSSSYPSFSMSGGSGNLKNSQTHSQSQSVSGCGDYCDNTRKSESTGNGSGSGGDTGSNGGSYRHVQLTEEVLCKHTADMQKMFLLHQRTGGKMPKDKWKIKTMKKLMKKPDDRTRGVKRSGEALEQEATVQKQPYLAPPQPGSNALKTSGADTWPQAENKSITSQGQTVVPSVGSNMMPQGRLATPSFPGMVPGYYLPTSSPSMSPMHPMENLMMTQAQGHTLLMPPQQPAYIQQQGMAMPVHYMSTFPGLMYQPVGPPLFNAPPLMLPNMVFQQTVVQSPHGQISGQISIPLSSDTEKPSGAESEQELENTQLSSKHFNLKRSMGHMRQPDSRATSVKAEPGSVRGSTTSASGKILCSHSHNAESIRSYMEDGTILSSGCVPKDREKNRDSSQFSQSTSVRAEAESVGSPGKQDKTARDGRETCMDNNSSDMITSFTNSSREYISTDDSMPNILSENSDNSELSSSEMRWNIPRSKCRRPVLHDPPWLNNVQVTPELLYRYQLETKELVDVLRHDMDILKKTRQPACVDDQLSSLYKEMELEGSSDLHIEEGITSSSGEENPGPSTQENLLKKKKSLMYFSKMAMMHEENAPMPPPGSMLLTRPPARDSSDSSS